jgi:hypothetical protein
MNTSKWTLRGDKMKRRLGNPPTSPYHHKTEMPGVPGHHRLSGCGCLSEIRQCFRIKTPTGEQTACFSGKSAYGDGIVNVDTYVKKGKRLYYNAGKSGRQTMSYDDFDRRMSELVMSKKAIRMS